MRPPSGLPLALFVLLVYYFALVAVGLVPCALQIFIRWVSHLRMQLFSFPRPHLTAAIMGRCSHVHETVSRMDAAR